MSLGLFNCRLIQPAGDQLFFFAGVAVDPIVKTVFSHNKRMPGGVLGLSFGGGYGSPPLAIPALESALGSHPCGALSSVQVDTETKHGEGGRRARRGAGATPARGRPAPACPSEQSRFRLLPPGAVFP